VETRFRCPSCRGYHGWVSVSKANSSRATVVGVGFGSGWVLKRLDGGLVCGPGFLGWN